MQLRSALLAATMLAMPIVASAQPVTGLYVGAGVRRKHQSAGADQEPGVPDLGPAWQRLSTSGNVNGSAGFAGVLASRLGLRQRPACGNRR